MKTCPSCEFEKPYSEFYKDKHRKDGHGPYCKLCKRAKVAAGFQKYTVTSKICSGCKIEQQAQEFANSYKSADGLQSYCKTCKSIRDETRKETLRGGIKKWIRNFKESAGCADCPENAKWHDYWRLDFDHVKGVKLFNVSAAGNSYTYTFDEIKDEIAKCEVVCSNCHRDRTHNRFKTLADRVVKDEESPGISCQANRHSSVTKTT